MKQYVIVKIRKMCIRDSNSFILALSMCVIPFIPGDIFKIGVTLILSKKINLA